MYLQRLHEAHGVIRTAELRELGMSKYAIAKEVDSGALVRIERGWVAAPTAEKALVQAAQLHLTLSCITQASRLGLWVRKEPARHFAVPRPGSERRVATDRLHYWKPVEFRRPFALEDSLVNVLSNVARCQPHEDAVATWDSALNKQLITRTQLEQAQLCTRAKLVLKDTDRFSDSGLESYLRVRLRWLPTSIRAQTWLLGRRVDFLVGSRLVLQIDGGTHVGAQRNKDNSHDAALVASGYTVLRFGYAQIMYEWSEVQESILCAMRAGLHTQR